MTQPRKVYQEDCLNALDFIEQNSIDLIYLDPPYNTGRDFGAYNDKWANPKVYTDYIADRLVPLKLVLKPTGSIYLHCSSDMCHYIKLALDEVFGLRNYRNQIVWCYSTGGASPARFSAKHDIIYYYVNSATYTFNTPRVPYLAIKADQRRDGFDPRGKIMSDWWTDINALNTNTKERTGYPTQKPIALLERIISASSNPGDTVLDPFCGSGTTLVAAERLNRQAIGIDTSFEAVMIARQRYGK